MMGLWQGPPKSISSFAVVQSLRNLSLNLNLYSIVKDKKKGPGEYRGQDNVKRWQLTRNRCYSLQRQTQTRFPGIMETKNFCVKTLTEIVEKQRQSRRGDYNSNLEPNLPFDQPRRVRIDWNEPDGRTSTFKTTETPPNYNFEQFDYFCFVKL